MLRNKFIKAGIPLRKPREEIYTLTKEWKEKGNVQEVRLHDIPGIRLELQTKFNMFSTGQTLQCRRMQYATFVEKRIRAVLEKKLGVEIK